MIEALQLQDKEITSQIINDLLNDNFYRHERMKLLYEQYKGRTPIFDRKFDDESKVCSHLSNDYRGAIIDTKNGYFLGNEIGYELDKTKYKSKTDYEKALQELNDFKLRNDIADLDSTTGEYASVCGQAARLLYVNSEGKESVMNIKPWEAIFVYDATTDEIQYAFIYYRVKIRTDNDIIWQTKVEWYDNKNVTFYKSDYYSPDGFGSFVLDDTEPVNPKPHLFDFVPLIPYYNNNLWQGDFEKVESLIDGYDRLLSDAQNEVEEFRLAYLAFYGVEPTKEDIARFRMTGAISFPENTDGKFITKDLNGAVTFIENHKNTLNDNIFRFSKTVDMSDEKFSGSAQSGESRKWKLLAIENDAMNKERKFTKANRLMFKVLQSAWTKKNIPFDYLSIQYRFTRNVPLSLVDAATTTSQFKGNISEKTRLGLLPFVTDVDAEMQAMKDDLSDGVDLDDVNTDDNVPV
jgi:SPP1 family phage portal protein